MISKNEIKYIQALHLKKNRDSQGLFIIEGIKSVTEFILNNSTKVKYVFATAEYLQQHSKFLEQKGVSFTEVTFDELKKISLQSSPNQVLAIIYKREEKLNNQLLQKEITIFLDDIRDPGNFGTIIRIADWFGLKQIICSKNTTELYNPKTLQASMGAILRTNVIYMDFEDVLSASGNITVYGAVLNGKNIYTTKLEKGIIVIGNEANGISENILSKLNQSISIPAAPNNGSESLNAANACAIICSEFHRQLNY